MTPQPARLSGFTSSRHSRRHFSWERQRWQTSSVHFARRCWPFHQDLPSSAVDHAPTSSKSPQHPLPSPWDAQTHPLLQPSSKYVVCCCLAYLHIEQKNSTPCPPLLSHPLQHSPYLCLTVCCCMPCLRDKPAHASSPVLCGDVSWMHTCGRRDKVPPEKASSPLRMGFWTFSPSHGGPAA